MDDFGKLKRELGEVLDGMGGKKPSAASPFTTFHTSPEGTTVPGSPGPQVGGTRLDPRDGTVLQKVVIRDHSNSPEQAITIDVNPKSGGIFLDKGELDALSKIPNVVSILEASLIRGT
jgi:hypothetical protein